MSLPFFYPGVELLSVEKLPDGDGDCVGVVGVVLDNGTLTIKPNERGGPPIMQIALFRWQLTENAGMFRSGEGGLFVFKSEATLLGGGDPASRARLRTTDWVAFRFTGADIVESDAVSAECEAVLTAHIQLPGASLSSLERQDTPGGAAAEAAAGAATVPTKEQQGDEKEDEGAGAASAEVSSMWGEKAAKVIERGSIISAAALVDASIYTSKLLARGGESLRDRLTPLEEDVVISDRTKSVANGMKSAGAAMADVAGAATSAVGDGIAFVKDTLAPAVASKLREKFPRKPSDGDNDDDDGDEDGVVADSSGTVKAQLKAIGRASLIAFDRAMDAVDEAATEVVNEVGVQTTSTIGHKYGAEAADTTKTALSGAGKTLEAARAAKRLGPKAIAKHIAKDTAKEAAHDYLSKEDGNGANGKKPMTANNAEAAGWVQVQEEDVAGASSDKGNTAKDLDDPEGGGFWCAAAAPAAFRAGVPVVDGPPPAPAPAYAANENAGAGAGASAEASASVGAAATPVAPPPYVTAADSSNRDGEAQAAASPYSATAVAYIPPTAVASSEPALQSLSQLDLD